MKKKSFVRWNFLEKKTGKEIFIKVLYCLRFGWKINFVNMASLTSISVSETIFGYLLQDTRIPIYIVESLEELAGLAPLPSQKNHKRYRLPNFYDSFFHPLLS